MNEALHGTLRAWETRRTGQKERKAVHLNIRLPDNHMLEAVKAEAEVRNMSVNGFMRSMIRGYFAAALHGR